MISDEEQNSTTDSEESSPQPPQAERRQYHNLLERNRRNVLKYSFWRLRCQIPSLTKKKLASRAKILKRAIDYIRRTERKKPAIQQNIRELERDNAFFREQSIALQQAEEEGDRDKLEAIFDKIDEVAAKTYDIGSRSEDEYEDSSDTESENEQNDEAVGPEDPSMEWSSDNDQDNDEPEEPEQGYSVNVSEESESSESIDSSEVSSSEYE